MNILVVNHYVGTPKDGMGNRHYMFAKELMSRGHHVTILTSSFIHKTRTEDHLTKGEQWKKETVEGVPFVWVRTPQYIGNGLDRIWNMLYFAYRTMISFKKFQIERPDIVVGSSPHLFAALSAQKLAKKLGVPFVLEIRDLWPESLIELGDFSRRNPGILVMEAIERHLYRSADHIICLLPGGIEHISYKGGNKGKITWVPNGIDLKLVPIPQPLQRTDSKFTVMYAGAHGLANGLDSILDAAAFIQSKGLGDKVCFRFIGDGPEKVRLQQRTEQEDLRLVTFEPFVPRSEIYGYLQEADAFIVTLRDVGLYKYGISLNKLYDYLVCARPIIFGASSLNNPIEESDGGLTVPPEDPEAMAQTIIQLMDMSLEERWEMGLRGRCYAEEFHDYAKLADRIEAVLFGLTGGSC